MSLDDNNIKSRNSQIYFDSLYRDKKKKKNNNKNHIRFQNTPKKTNNNNYNLENQIFLQRRKKRQLTLGPLSSTLESTVSTSKRQNDDENSTLSSEIYQKITIKSKKLLQPTDEDMKFLFDIFYKKRTPFFQNNHNNMIKQNTISNKNRINKNETIEFFNYNNYNKYDLNAIKKYLIKMQKKYNFNRNIMIYENHFPTRINVSGDLMDTYHSQKLYDLIARYSIIIFIFIKSGKINQAKEIFLLMIKENMSSINYIHKKLSTKYLVINRKINIYRDIPKITYQLAKMYSFLIKYSKLFNTINYHNIFIDKYFQIQFLNYKFFIIKGTMRGFNAETRNQIKYWLSYCFLNFSYYNIYNYNPLKGSIIFNYNIVNLYNYADEASMTDSEKSLLIKAFYNQGILYYFNGQKDEALSSLNQALEKIISFSDDYYSNNNIIKKKNVVNIFKKHVKENVVEINDTKRSKKKSTISTYNYKYLEDSSKKDDKKKAHKIAGVRESDKTVIFNNNHILESINSNDNIGKMSKDLSVEPKNNYEELKSSIYKGFKKKKITIEDIELLIKFGKDKGLLNEDTTMAGKGLDFLFKYKESFSAIKKKITLPKGSRGSHINFHTSIKIKDFYVPEKFKNPLLRKIELLMSIIELDKKNYEAAYEHVLKVLYIIFLLKISNINCNNDFFNRQKIEINEYFQLIENTYENDMKYKQFLEKSSSKSILTVNDFKNQSNINLNFSRNNSSSFIIFENKEAEDNFYSNYMNSNKNNNNNNNNINNINNNNNENYNQNINYNKNKNIVKEFEKFFLFLNKLSLYQIKILNETQPDDKKRNHLPIMLSNQFKDCLNRIQRIELDNLEIMSLSRFMILKDPNKWIIPTNLNYLLIERHRNSPIKNRNSLFLNLERYNFIDDTFMKTKEYKNYLSIINSEKSTPEIRDFLRINKNFVFKIIKESSAVDINNIIEYPYIIIDQIKKYKKKIKKIKKSIEEKNMKNIRNRPRTLTLSIARKKIQKKNYNNNKYIFKNLNKQLKRLKSSNENNYIIKNTLNIKNTKKSKKKYIKAVENNKFMKESSKSINFNEESNVSFEDYSLSPELSSFYDDDEDNI